MALSADDIVAKFPVKTLPIIQEAPDYEIISSMMQALYGNAASLSTTSGWGAHGHIGLIMTPALYLTMENSTNGSTKNKHSIIQRTRNVEDWVGAMKVWLQGVDSLLLLESHLSVIPQ